MKKTWQKFDAAVDRCGSLYVKGISVVAMSAFAYIFVISMMAAPQYARFA